MSGTSKLPPGDDPYRILGVAPAADMDEITRAYRRLLRQHHPDTAPGHTDLDAHRLRQVLAAYQQLRHRRAPTTPATGTTIPIHHRDTRRDPASSHTKRGVEDVWLGESTGAGSARRRIPISRRGADTTAAVTITAEQAGIGTTVTVATLVDPHTQQLRNIHVRIPAGTRDGQTLRIPGRGLPGHADGAPGDLHLTVYHVTT